MTEETRNARSRTGGDVIDGEGRLDLHRRAILRLVAGIVEQGRAQKGGRRACDDQRGLCAVAVPGLAEIGRDERRATAINGRAARGRRA